MSSESDPVQVVRSSKDLAVEIRRSRGNPSAFGCMQLNAKIYKSRMYTTRPCSVISPTFTGEIRSTTSIPLSRRMNASFPWTDPFEIVSLLKMDVLKNRNLYPPDDTNRRRMSGNIWISRGAGTLPFFRHASKNFTYRAKNALESPLKLPKLWHSELCTATNSSNWHCSNWFIRAEAPAATGTKFEFCAIFGGGFRLNTPKFQAQSVAASDGIAMELRVGRPWGGYNFNFNV